MAKKQPNPMDGRVGQRLRERRTLIGMSQERLGELLGITFQQVQKYERGVNRVAAGRLFQIAQILGADIDYFYSGLAEPAQGFAEGQRDAPVADPRHSEQVELAMAFSRIKQHKRRRRAIALVKQLADEEAAED